MKDLNHLKQTIGNNVKKTRERKELRQIDICDDEEVLTTRQLARIESGQSLPNIASLIFLANKLNISLDEIVGREVLSNDYQYLKEQLFTMPTFGSRERLLHKKQIIFTIYSNYYDELPEDEQLIIDVLQSKLDLYSGHSDSYDEGVFQRKFKHSIQKSNFQFRDLVLIDYYLFKCALGLVESTYVSMVYSILMTMPLPSDNMIQCIIESMFISLILQFPIKDYPSMLNKFTEVIQLTGHYEYNTLIFFLESEYYQIFECNLLKADKLLQKAVLLSEIVQVDNLKSIIEGKDFRGFLPL